MVQRMIPMVFVAGYSNSGKTTAIIKMIKIFKRRGYRLAVIKHAAHGYDFDSSGKDSDRCFEAGADQMAVVGPDSYAIRVRSRYPPSLQEVCNKISGVDLILIEGFKNQDGPKIEILRKDYSGKRLSGIGQIVAMVSDKSVEADIPCFSPMQMEELVDYMVDLLGLAKG